MSQRIARMTGCQAKHANSNPFGSRRGPLARKPRYSVYRAPCEWDAGCPNKGMSFVFGKWLCRKHGHLMTAREIARVTGRFRHA